MSYKHVKLFPAVGEDYESRRFGVKTLILGESHYSKKPIGPDFTKQIMAESKVASGAPAIGFSGTLLLCLIVAFGLIRISFANSGSLSRTITIFKSLFQDLG